MSKKKKKLISVFLVQSWSVIILIDFQCRITHLLFWIYFQIFSVLYLYLYLYVFRANKAIQPTIKWWVWWIRYFCFTIIYLHSFQSNRSGLERKKKKFRFLLLRSFYVQIKKIQKSNKKKEIEKKTEWKKIQDWIACSIHCSTAFHNDRRWR